jgi:amidophosphoribosyltransferase
LDELQRKRSDKAKQKKSGIQDVADTPVDIVGVQTEV